MPDEETTRDIINRLKNDPRRLEMIGQPRVTVANRNFNPTFSHKAQGKKSQRVKCLDNGKEYASLILASLDSGGSSTGLSTAFHRAQGEPRIARFKGKRWQMID